MLQKKLKGGVHGVHGYMRYMMESRKSISSNILGVKNEDGDFVSFKGQSKIFRLSIKGV